MVDLMQYIRGKNSPKWSYVLDSVARYAYTLGEPNPDSLSTKWVRIGLSQSVCRNLFFWNILTAHCMCMSCPNLHFIS